MFSIHGLTSSQKFVVQDSANGGIGAMDILGYILNLKTNPLPKLDWLQSPSIKSHPLKNGFQNPLAI